MNLLGSRSFSPERQPQERTVSMSCRKVEMRAYGSDQGGGGRPTAYFQLHIFENWERRTLFSASRRNIMTTEVVDTCNPITFFSYIDLLLKPQEMESWFDGFFVQSQLFAETRHQIRRGLTVFVPGMISKALSKRFSRVDFVIEAHEVIDMTSLLEEPGAEEDIQRASRINNIGSSSNVHPRGAITR